MSLNRLVIDRAGGANPRLNHPITNQVKASKPQCQKPVTAAALPVLASALRLRRRLDRPFGLELSSSGSGLGVTPARLAQQLIQSFRVLGGGAAILGA